jgi:hypothetical protein
MYKFPSICVDNFFMNPDKIRTFALEQEFFPSPGNYPGKRSKPISELNPSMYENIVKKIVALFYDINIENIICDIEMNFQLVESMDSDKNSPKNKGWVHTDGYGNHFAGIIYLNPEIDPNCGTSLFRLVDEENYDTNTHTVRDALYKSGIDNDYDEVITKKNSCFEETVRFQNYYNRLVAYDGDLFHGVNSFYTEKEPRLTLVFFIKSFNADSGYPLFRANVNSSL